MEQTEKTDYFECNVINEDFTSFKTGYFPSDISAIGEYHYFKPGYTGIWYEPNKCTGWQGQNCWMIKSMDRRRFIEQQLDKRNIPWGDTVPMLVAGDKQWRTVRVETEIRTLAASDRCGIVFRYTDSRHFYWFALENDTAATLYKKDEETLILLASCEYCYDIDSRSILVVEAIVDSISCYINDKLMLQLNNNSYESGYVGIASRCPSRFYYVKADIPKEERDLLLNIKKQKNAELQAKKVSYPAMKLWKTINLKNFGSARNYRCADLNGDGVKELIFIQSMKMLNSEDEMMISCMTAVDLSGNILWQIGEPARNAYMATCDLPVQVYDIDGDGKNEIIYAKDFSLIVADAATGKTKFMVWTPESIKHDKYKIYQNIILERIVVDSIRICNFSGKERPSDILVKDRYNNIWVYEFDNNMPMPRLKLLWHRHVNCGHFPYAFDINGDGRDELIAGHSLISADGELIWELPGMDCHVDEIVIGKFDPDNPKYQIAFASGEDGFILADEDGNIIARDMPGHAQRVSVANYRPELPGLEICVTTFWRNTGIITYYDYKGKRLFSFEPGANGNIINPVSWSADGRILALYSASTEHGGLYDGKGDCVVMFPNDGHSELCCDAVDLIGDEREEILCWDEKMMYIYTQEDNPSKLAFSHRKRYEEYNYSNYRGEFIF
ncbi:MAG: hypothetical protein FWD71_14165 [Oscillospiraceae bacterium]|nr:hypothetical protein [Oscillospiraceae bacterium]